MRQHWILPNLKCKSFQLNLGLNGKKTKQNQKERFVCMKRKLFIYIVVVVLQLLMLEKDDDELLLSALSMSMFSGFFFFSFVDLFFCKN
jgi:hypothetical protein